MYKIIHKQVIAPDIKKIDIAAPLIAAKALPGQFVMVTPTAQARAIPMTIIDSDEKRSSITLLVHEVGETTKNLGGLSIGEGPVHLVGPLGAPAELDKYGLVICIATGVGAAQILPICRGLKKRGNKVIGIIGAKSKKLMMLETQMRVVCDEIFIATNDGSYERKGLATGLLKELLNKYNVKRVYAIGSVEMMETASQMTKAKNIPLRVTLSPYMTNGLGTCSSCRVKVGGEYRLACVEGPEFDGHLVDYNDLTKRMNALESDSWAHQPHPINRKRPGLTTFVKSLWGFQKKVSQDEARRCPQCAIATCLPGCPLGIDIPGFIRFLREGDSLAALDLIKQSNPFPAICGRICPAPCERACIFNADGSPIAIRTLERYASDNGQTKLEKITPPQGKKIAIIGSGPSGMSAAFYLAKAGCAVTIFEAAQAPGGLLRYAIPEFRLPQKILDEQFTQLSALGVQVVTDVFLGRTLFMDELFMRGFAGVLLATGAGLPRFSHLEGASLGGVYYDSEYLMRLQISDKTQVFDSMKGMVRGNTTAVVGHGLAALDCARMARRLGHNVHLIFSGLEEQLELAPHILKETMDEGITIHSQVEVLEIIDDGEGFVSSLKCRKLEMIESAEGLSLQATSDEPLMIDAQTIILSLGERPNNFLKNHLPQLKWDSDGSLWADAQTGMTSVDKVFACGNAVSGAGPVVDAIAGGKKAAQKIIEFLK